MDLIRIIIADASISCRSSVIHSLFRIGKLTVSPNLRLVRQKNVKCGQISTVLAHLLL
jgi:hypothetical protein